MIIKTPRGEAPEHIRQAWVGITLPCRGKFPADVTVGVLTGNPVDQGQDAYHVQQAVACEILAQEQPEAAQWWYANGFPRPGRLFAFYEDEVLVLGQKVGVDQTSWG